MNTRERNEREREGGGASSNRQGRDDAASGGGEVAADAGPIGHESSVVNRRDIPGGSFQPARTPGASGPTTRDPDRSVSHESNDPLVGRTEMAGDIQMPEDPAN